MSKLKKILLALALVFIVLQFLPSDRNENGRMVTEDITKVVDMPANVQAVLKTSCYDCHSNHTEYPWYSNIQPIRYMQDRHVRKGKADLNFSEFGSYSKRKQRNKLKAIASSIKEEMMPIASYTLIHRNARLSQANKTLITAWVKDQVNRF